MKPATKEAIIAWYDHPCRLRLASATRKAMSAWRHSDETTFLSALEAAVWEDVQCLSCNAPAALFDELAVLAVVLRSAVEPELTIVAQLLLRGAPLVQTLESKTSEGRRAFVERIARAVADDEMLGGVEQICVRHAADLAEWGWEDELSAWVPTYIPLVLDAVDRDNHPFVMLALSALTAFAEVNAVPSPSQQVTLMNALRASSPTVDEVALGTFLLAMAQGCCFMELAHAAARTRHDVLLSEFKRIAPTRAVEWLHEQIDVVALGAHGAVGIA